MSKYIIEFMEENELFYKNNLDSENNIPPVLQL